MNYRFRHSILAISLLTSGFAACGGETATDSPQVSTDSCQSLIETMSACYPDLIAHATCTEQTIAEFERSGLDSESCQGIESMGKSDTFTGFDGCDPGQHVCGWIFCCDGYELTWFPESEADWDIVGVVNTFQAATPSEEFASVMGASKDQLAAGRGVSFVQDVAEYPGQEPVPMAVEITRLIVQKPYEAVAAVLPAQMWGLELGTRLGGEIKIFEKDSQGRAVRQLERMVLAPYPLDIETPLTNNDMTKVEVIEYGDGYATVFWRVMFSDNDTTETDVGSVDFRRFDDSSTVITFHSAHRLNLFGGIHIANGLVKLGLKSTFMGLLFHYRDLIEATLGS